MYFEFWKHFSLFTFWKNFENKKNATRIQNILTHSVWHFSYIWDYKGEPKQQNLISARKFVKRTGCLQPSSRSPSWCELFCFTKSQTQLFFLIKSTMCMMCISMIERAHQRLLYNDFVDDGKTKQRTSQTFWEKNMVPPPCQLSLSWQFSIFYISAE